MRQAGISKFFGLSSLAIFQIVFSLVFEEKNWFRLLESDRGADLPGKDVIYRFLNQASFAWRRFLQAFSLRIVRHFESLISLHRVRVFIIDDSVLSRNRSKKAELLARVFDHSTGKFTKGYTMLPLGWSDGFSFAPLDFVMLSSANHQIGDLRFFSFFNVFLEQTEVMLKYGWIYDACDLNMDC